MAPQGDATLIGNPVVVLPLMNKKEPSTEKLNPFFVIS